MKKNSVVLVTGASSGIGEAIAARLLADGFTVYGAARRLDRMSGLRAQGLIALQMDVTREEDVAAGLATIAREHGGVDVLVNNAGFATYGAMEDTSIDDARRQFEVNLFAVARLTQGVLPYMRAAGRGHVVNISSMGGRIHTPLGAWYHATKHALEGWSDCLRLELAPFGIHVVVIQPGLIQSEFNDVFVGPMMQRSGSSPYADLAARVEAAARRSQRRGRASPPTVVAAAVSKALAARRPKTRYAVGSMARPMLLLRRWLSDRLFDRALMSQV